MTRILLAMMFAITSGCATYSVVVNKPLAQAAAANRYSILDSFETRRPGSITLALTFSGGGTRAAALAYGVIQELRDTIVILDGQERRLLDEVDLISAVSGGSFTAAYYGLHGERTFSDFEPVFLRRNVTSELLHRLLNPAWWFSSIGRTEMAIAYYQDRVFSGATFADLQAQRGPLIVINASDLGHGVRFSFLQEYFDLLCSDLSRFPLADAVTASSAVPILFNPVVLENHAGCNSAAQQWMVKAREQVAGSPQLAEVVTGLSSFTNKDRRRYIHLVDGGITDNLGLRALYEIIEVAGGPQAFLKRVGRKPASRIVVISVNASTRTGEGIEATNQPPPVEATLNAVSDVQLQRYNVATLELMQSSLKRWSDALSTAQQSVEPYFVKVGFDAVKEPQRRLFFNQIPTDFSLDGEQVDELITAGRTLLRNNAEFRRFVNDTDGTLAK